MKKAAFLSVAAVLVLVLGAVGVLYWKRLSPPAVRPDALLPGGTLVLVEVVDLPQSAIRWQKTELNQLWQEPEVQAFFEKAQAHPLFQEAGQLRKELVKLWPRQAFAAVVSMDGTTPKMLVGFSFAGDGAVAEPWLADPRRQMKDAHPAGKAELIQHGKTEIATYTDADFVFAEATHAGWHLAANDLALLKDALDRLDAPKGTRPSGLAEDADYQKAFAALPADPELRMFARTGIFVERLQAALAAGDPTKTMGLESLGKVRAIAGISKIEGGLFREALFSLGEQGVKQEPLTRGALELTNSETTAFYTVKTGSAGMADVPPEVAGMLPFVGTLETALKTQKATLADLPEIFGPEISVIVPKLQGSVSAAVAIGVRDPQRAASLAEALTDPQLGESAWVRSEEDGLTIYTAPPSGGLIAFSPVLTVNDRYWLLGASAAGLAPLAKRDPATPQLDHTAAWRDVAGSVVAPTESFGFINLSALFESSYAMLRPMIALGLMGSEEMGQYVDAGKLPSAAVISRHLGGMAFSQGAVPGGNLWEARGSISLGEALLGGAAAYLASGASLPKLPALPGAATPAPRKESEP